MILRTLLILLTVLTIQSCKLVKKEVSRIFPGIDQDKKFVFYWAFNELPDGERIVEHYGYVDQKTN